MQPAVSLSGPVRKSDVQGEALSHIPARRLVAQGVVWGMGYVLCLGALFHCRIRTGFRAAWFSLFGFSHGLGLRTPMWADLGPMISCLRTPRPPNASS